VISDSAWSIHFAPAGASALRNRTGRAYRVLHDHFLQPSRLEVTDAHGTVVPTSDERATMKFDTRARQEAFVEVGDGGELPLFQLRIEGGANRYSMAWGPFRIGPLEAGTYTATVIFEARRDRGFDEAQGKDVPIKDAWIGSVRSAPLTLRLPLATP
jgi:hypothetical protein